MAAPFPKGRIGAGGDEGENEDGRESYSLIGEDLGRNEFSTQATD